MTRYALKRLDFPAVNPVNEGLGSLIMVSLVFGILGNDCWAARSPIANLEYYYLYIIFVLGFSTFSVALSAYKINLALGTSEHIRCYGPVALVTFVYFLLVAMLNSDIAERNMFTIGYTFGFLFARLVVGSKDRRYDRSRDRNPLSRPFAVNNPGKRFDVLFGTDGEVFLAKAPASRKEHRLRNGLCDASQLHL